MDFASIEGGCLASSSFNYTITGEDGPFQDTYRRKSSRKRLQEARTSALVIDQLKSSFQRAGDFTPRMRARRNWRPEFLMKYLGDHRRNEECAAMHRGESCCKSLVPGTIRIYSIGLRSCARSDGDDLSGAFSAMRNLRRRLRRSIIMCKHWVAQSTSFSTAKLKFDVLEVDRPQESSRHEDAPDTLPNNPELGDSSSAPDLGHSDVRKCGAYERPRVIQKDAQVQTSSRKKTLRRRKQKANRLRATNGGGGILRREQDESMLDSSAAIFRSDFPDRMARKEDSRLSVRFLENKRAEYINKFTAVKRQIEEITTTLKETCCSGESWRGEERDDEEDDADPTKEGNVPTGKDEMVRESVDDPESVERSLDVAGVTWDNETPVFSGRGWPRNVIASTTNPRSGANDVFACDCTLTVKQMLRPWNESAGKLQQRRAKCRLGRQIPSQALTKDDDEGREFSEIGDQSSREIYLRNCLMAANDDDEAPESSGSGGPKLHGAIADEITVLNDIKRRIDRDFDNAKSENDTEDSLPAPQRSVDFHNGGSQLHRSPTTRNPTETRQTHNSTWLDATSELSNQNSSLSVYHSCMRFPSFVSLRENGDELALEAEEDDSYLNSQSNVDCYDLSVHTNADYPRVFSHMHSQSNFNLVRLHGDENVTQDTFTSGYSCPSKFLSEVIDESSNMFGCQESADNRAYDCESKESRVDFERQYADATFETSKSSRYIGSMDSGVFVNSSLLDLRPHENSFDEDKPSPERKQRRVRTREVRGSSRTFDFSSDSNSSSNCRTDDTLDRKINDVIEDLTKNLVLCERRVRMRLREMRRNGLKPRETRRPSHSPPRACKFHSSLYGASCEFFESPRRFCEDEKRISEVSTPSFMSLPESEVEELSN